MSSGGVSEYRGNYDQCLEQMALQQKTPSREKKQESGQKEDYKARKQRESALRKAAGRIERLERELDENELEQKKLNSELTSEEVLADYQKLMEFTRQLEQLKERERAITAEWEEAMLQKEEMENQRDG